MVATTSKGHNLPKNWEIGVITTNQDRFRCISSATGIYKVTYTGCFCTVEEDLKFWYCSDVLFGPMLLLSRENLDWSKESGPSIIRHVNLAA